MWTRALVVTILILGTFRSDLLHSQQKPAVASPLGAQEFPVTFQESVTAGKTPIGTKVQAKLGVATLVGGQVIPRNAVFSGQVVESVAKTKTESSRLAIRMDSVQWKDGSTPIKVFLSEWYYPARDETGQNLQYGPEEPASRTWNGAGAYPDPNSKVYKPFPGGDTNSGAAVPDTPTATTSSRRVVMKDVQSESGSDGTLALVSKHVTIKLDKFTTYVLASSNPPAAK